MSDAGMMTALFIATILMVAGFGLSITVWKMSYPNNFRQHCTSASLGSLFAGFMLMYFTVIGGSSEFLLVLSALFSFVGFTLYGVYTRLPDSYTPRNTLWLVSNLMMATGFLLLASMIIYKVA